MFVLSICEQDDDGQIDEASLVCVRFCRLLLSVLSSKKKTNKNPELLPAGGMQDVQHAGSDRCSFPLCEAAVVSGVEGAEPGHNVKST